MTEATTIDDIRAAQRRLSDVARVTPLLESSFLNALAGRRVLVKAECLQRTGSFKFRGGWSAVSALPEAARKRGVIAYSSGNHAQGVAHAAELMGVPAVIVMPGDAPALKLANTRAHGAEVVLYDRVAGEDREAIGGRIAEARGLTLIRPYDDPEATNQQEERDHENTRVRSLGVGPTQVERGSQGIDQKDVKVLQRQNVGKVSNQQNDQDKRHPHQCHAAKTWKKRAKQ